MVNKRKIYSQKKMKGNIFLLNNYCTPHIELDS